MWLLMIVLHTAMALAAFGVGLVAVDPRRARDHWWTMRALVGFLLAMTVFVAAAMAAHWSDLDGIVQVVFTGLVVLAGYMVWRALHALRLGPHQTGGQQLAHVGDVGFVLIALADGFVIVAAIDLGVQTWIVAPLALGVVAVGHGSLNRLKERVASPVATAGA